jgi:serine/threonine protein kinase
VACALVCIHAKGFVHKDVKPDNVVVSAGGVARLCDMGVLTPVSEQSRCAPVLWSAPELLDDSLRYSEKVDIYSFGLLTNYLFSGLMHTKTKDGRVILPAPEFFSRLVHECLSEPPERRPSAEDILRFLRRFKQLVLEEVLEEEGLGEAGLRELDF